MAHDVFICYASPDKSIADAVCATLEANRIRCWVAPRDVLPGMGYADELIEAISESPMMVLVFSSSSNNSPQVLREVERAVSKGIPILPFRIQDVPLSRAMEYFISSHHWLDALTPPLERHLQHLAETVKLLLARTAGPEDLGEELGAPRKAPAAEIAAEQGPETRAAEKRRLVLSSLGLVLARVGLRTRAAASGLGHLVERLRVAPRVLFAVTAGLGHLVERLRIAPRVLFAVTAGLGGGGIAAILLVLFVFVGQDSGGDSLPESAAQGAAVSPTPSPTPPPTPTLTPLPSPTPPPTPTLTPLPSPAPTKEADEDGDTVSDASDNCPNTYNPDQANTYGDERGDACEPAPPPPDGDNDTVPDASDNCPNTYNPDQANTYGDERGDACEPSPTPIPTPPPTPVPEAVQPIGGATYRYETGGQFEVSADGSSIAWSESERELLLYCTGGPPEGPTELWWTPAGDFGPSGLPIKSDGSFYYYGVEPFEEGEEMRTVFSGQFTSPETAEGYFRAWLEDSGTYPGYVLSCDTGALTWTAVAE